MEKQRKGKGHGYERWRVGGTSLPLKNLMYQNFFIKTKQEKKKAPKCHTFFLLFTSH